MKKDLDWLFENYQGFFDKFDMQRDNIISVYYDWREDNTDTVIKYLWAIFERLLHEAYLEISSPATRFKVLGLILREMREYKIKYEGEKANDLHKRYLFCQLKQFEIQSKDVQVMAINCCPYCAMLHGKKVSVEEALDEQLLPSKSCKNEVGCNCFYKAH